MIFFTSSSFKLLTTVSIFFQLYSEVAAQQQAYVTYHSYTPGFPLSSVSCSDGSNGLYNWYGPTGTIDPMAPYVTAVSNVVWNSPNCGNCYKLTSSTASVYVTAIDGCGAGPNGSTHFDLHPTAFGELLGSAGIAAGSDWVTYETADPSNCKGNLKAGGSGSGGGGGGGEVTPPPPTEPTCLAKKEICVAGIDSCCDNNVCRQWLNKDTGELGGKFKCRKPLTTTGSTPPPPPPPPPEEEEEIIISDVPTCPSGQTGHRLYAWNCCEQFYHCVDGSVIGSPISVPNGMLFDEQLQNQNHDWAVQCAEPNCNRRELLSLRGSGGGQRRSD